MILKLLGGLHIVAVIRVPYVLAAYHKFGVELLISIA